MTPQEFCRGAAQRILEQTENYAIILPTTVLGLLLDYQNLVYLNSRESAVEIGYE